jgi:hypothetical protein
MRLSWLKTKTSDVANTNNDKPPRPVIEEFKYPPRISNSVPTKKVVIYANCQGRAICDILRGHPTMQDEYDFENATVIGNYTYIGTDESLPWDIISQADLFIYQPISSDRIKHSTTEVLKRLKPTCKTCSFVYLYNYAFWECLVFADGDYDVGTLGMKYATINHEPITSLRSKGVSLEEIKSMIRSKNFDWKFKERYDKTQQILRDKEKDCTIKVADFIDSNHKHHLLFYTQNHPTMFFLRYVAKQIISQVGGHDADLLPDEDNLIHPDYNRGRTKHVHFPIGWFAWKHYGYTFIHEPTDNVMSELISQVEKIYNRHYVNFAPHRMDEEKSVKSLSVYSDN